MQGFFPLKTMQPQIMANFASCVRVWECVLNQLALSIQVEDAWLGEGVKWYDLI